MLKHAFYYTFTSDMVFIDITLNLGTPIILLKSKSPEQYYMIVSRKRGNRI